MAKMASGDLSLTSTSSQEEESPEYVGYDRTLRPNSNSSGSNSAANMANANASSLVGNAHVVVNNASNNNATVKKYDVIKNQYDSALVELSTLRHQHADTMRRCDDLANQLAFYQEQYMAAITQLKSSNGSNNSAYYYNDNGMTTQRQKCAGHCVESQKLLEELHLCKAEREKYKQKLSAALVDLDNMKVYSSQQTSKYKRIEQELHQLLSEKDNVLQEHQKMSDDLAVANKELEKYKKEEQLYKSEIKVLQKSRESSWSKEFSDSKDDFKEIEKLRKSLEKAQSEVERAQQDTEEAKRVRDWAISQREKIVQERDSVKTLCDKLRKERDRAISDLLSAIRDSEKIKKQKDEAQKKIDALKEQIENQNLDNASRRSFPTALSSSGSYESEDYLNIELVNYYADSDIGIILDDSNNRQLVCGVTNMSPAFGKLKINDVIIKVNNVDCQNLSKRLVLEQIRSSAPHVSLLISRIRHSKHHFYTVQLNLQNDTKHGLSLDSGIFISKIDSDSLAAFEPELDVGDRVLSINNKYVQRLDEALNLLNDERNETISIFALKSVQDGTGYNDTQRRMTTSSAQTDSIDSMHRVTGTKHPSKIADLLSKFKEKMHISKPGTDADHLAEQNDALDVLDSVLSGEYSTSEKSKRSKRSKKEKEAAAKSMGTWPRTNILNATIENPTSTIVQRDKKRPTLALFTAGPINIDKDDEREVCDDDVAPPLPPPSKSQQLATMRQTNGLAIKQNPNRNSNPIPTSMFFQNINAVNNNVIAAGNNSASYASYPRNSMYCGQPPNMDLQHEPLPRPAPILGANVRVKMQNNTHKYEQRANNYQNRYSYIAPTECYKTSGQQAQAQQQVVLNNNVGATEFASRKQLFDMFQNNKTTPQAGLFAPLANNYARGTQQNSLDIISLKSQNSIDSILSSKSPPISEYAISNYAKRLNANSAAMHHMPLTLPANNGKNVSKYPSDSESIASGIGMPGAGAVSHFQSHNNTGNNSNTSNVITGAGNRSTQFFPSLPPYSLTYTHAMRQIRHNSPLTLPSTPPLHATQLTSANAAHGQQQLDAGGSSALGIPTNSVDKFDLDYVAQAAAHNLHASHPYAHAHEFHHATAPTMNHYLSHHMTSSGVYEGGTFPRKKEQRLRIPSNPSVASKNSGVKNSSGSIDHHYAAIGGGSSSGVATNSSIINSQPTAVAPMPLAHHAALSNAAANGGGGSGRGSPMPHVHVEVLSHGGSKRNSNVPADFLCPGDLRRVTIDKSDKSLGITIQCNNNGGGIFVSTVAEKSIATRAGLQVGDQLLEVCGLNMRSATNDIAANVLRQCGNSITMLVQYNPEKFHSAEYEGSNNLEPESPVNHSGSPTPRNSPRPPLRNLMAPLPAIPLPVSANNNQLANSNVVMPQPNSIMSNKSIKDQSFADSLENQSDMSSSQDIPSSAATTTTASTTSTVYEEEARFVTLHMDKSKNLGIKLFGGNQVGIFVHDVHAGSPSDRAGIRKGDQILEYNGVDLRCVTAEQAATEISKLTDTVTMLVQNKLKKLKQIKDKESGDSFYIRVGFDRTGDLNDGDLRFVKDEVLYVDNTVFNGTFGLWRAWKLDAKGHRKECGIIPSQIKVEEELRSGEVADCEGGTARRGSTSARRSFFRRKKHQRSSSRDSTEIASFSNTQLSFFPDSGILNDEGSVLSYQRVERLDSPVRRPVLIIGPLSECVMDRLTMDFSNLFKLCEVTAMDCSQEAMEEGLQENIFVDYRRRGNKFECTTVESINNACKNDRRHCILDISISAVERLQRLQIYPIVLLLRFKSAKLIREIKDFGTDKISAKAAKEMYERALKLESDYKQYISAVIPGVSIKHMCTQIKDSVDKEQDKLLWVPVSG